MSIYSPPAPDSLGTFAIVRRDKQTGEEKTVDYLAGITAQQAQKDADLHNALRWTPEFYEYHAKRLV